MFTHLPKLKVTIADSSSYSRLVLSSMLQAQPDLEVLDTASDEQALLASLRLKKPDLVLADVNIQQKNKTTFLRQIHLESGVPVLMLCDKDRPSEEYLFKASQLGVYDFILKPAHRLHPKLRELQGEILTKIRALHKTRPAANISSVNAMVSGLKSAAIGKQPKCVVVVGASTGGTQAIENLIRSLSPRLDACILIALHLPAGFTHSFAQRLQSLTPLKVVEGRTGRNLEKGKIIIAPGGKNMVVKPKAALPGSFETFITSASESEYDKPSVNMLMKSVATYCGKNTLGVVLTGMGKDGTQGLEAIKNAGGFTLAQDRESSVIFGMAKSAIEKGHVEEVLPLAKIPVFINQYVAALPSVTQTLHTSIR